jgi:hypothetical protein
MPVSDFAGWTAAALMVATFSCRNPLWMRSLAVCTNLAFITYGVLASLAPVLALHSLLLPINVWRYRQCSHAQRAGGVKTDRSPEASTWPPDSGARPRGFMAEACPLLILRVYWSNNK